MTVENKRVVDDIMQDILSHAYRRMGKVSSCQEGQESKAPRIEKVAPNVEDAIESEVVDKETVDMEG